VADPRKVGVFGIECWTPYKASQNWEGPKIHIFSWWFL
jgi:hypothetical protein